jgi:hypothetical protein
VRLAVVALVFGLLVAGSIWGDDDHFPFGPFRMYASTESPDGTTSWLWLEGVTDAGQRAELPFEAFGLRRAEVEGSLDRLTGDPALLGEVVATYERRNPEAPRLTELLVVRRSQVMRSGSPAGAPSDEVVVSWRRP